MSGDHWARIEELFHAAVDLTPEQRFAYLDAHCSDEEIRAEVESLLRCEVGSIPEFHEAVGKVATEVGTKAEAPEHVGPYRIVREIGRGGMGAVYLATRDDDEFHRQVAVKLVKRGLDTDFILHRFRTERQILANLDHPGIAKLHDGGSTEDHRPYIVMEFIDGVPITTYCQEKHLPLAGRLALFGKVCDAVAHAHANLIVHRDLKPSNILVTKEGEPKLLDFGIAKLLDPELEQQTALMTGAQMRLLTPEYASPEQVRGEAITTATDVYALGAILYEMVSGEQAQIFTTHTPEELSRVVCETNVERKKIGNEVDSIIGMAMRKEVRRRYASVNQLSEDVERFLSQRPVMARPDSMGYRASKFVRRNRLAVAAALLVGLTLLGGILATSYQSRRAAENARRAEQRFAQVRKLANTFLFDVESRLRALSGATETRAFLIKTALEYLDSLAKEAEGDQALQLELAAAYEKVGDIQGASGESNLGQMQASILSYETANRIRERVAVSSPGTVANLVASSATSRKLAIALDRTTGGARESGKHYQKALAQAKLAVGLAPGDEVTWKELHANYMELVVSADNRGQVVDALRYAQELMVVAERLERLAPGPQAQASLDNTYFRTGSILRNMGQPEQGLALLQKATAIREDLARLEPGDVRHQQVLMARYRRAGDALGLPDSFHLGRTSEAITLHRKAVAIGERLLREDPKNRYVQINLEYSRHSLASTLSAAGAPEEALRLLEAVIATSEPRLADGKNMAVRIDLSTVFADRAEALIRLKRTAEAIRSWERCLELHREVATKRGTPQLLFNTIPALARLAEIYASQRRKQAARRHYEEMAVIAADYPIKKQNNELMLSTAQAYLSYAEFEQQQGNAARACPLYARSLGFWRELERRGVAARFLKGGLKTAVARNLCSPKPDVGFEGAVVV